METVKRQLPYDVKVTDVMKQLAVLWKGLPASERERYERLAEADKTRYFQQMENYTGPMRVPNKRQKKPEGAPKRAMSAFLSYSQLMRPAIRVQQPHLKNTEISSFLADRWKAASEEERRPHLEKEVREREKYHNEMVKWREVQGARDKDDKELSAPSKPLSPSRRYSFDLNTYASFLGVDDSLLELDYFEDPELGELVFDTGQNTPSIASDEASESSRSQRTLSTNRSDVPDSELAIGPGLYGTARSASSQSSQGSQGQSQSSAFNFEMTPLQIFNSRRTVDPLVGTVLSVPNSMPAPGARPSDSTHKRDRSAFNQPTQLQQRPPVASQRRVSLPYWADGSSDLLMDQAFRNDTLLDSGGPRRRAEYGSMSSVNHTLAAANRTMMYYGGSDAKSAIPSDMTPVWDFSNEEALRDVSLPPAKSSKKGGEEKKKQKQCMKDLLERQRSEQQEQEQRQARERQILMEMQGLETLSCSTSTSESGNSSPSEK